VVSRVTTRSDIWRIPVAGSPVENTRNAVRVTRQTGHVQTPTLSPDGTEVAYLSDNGGHGNLWIARSDGSTARQITFDTDPTVVVGVPKWSPRGDLIAFVRNPSGLDPHRGAHPSDAIDRSAGLWAICPDGSGLRRLVTGWSPCWSGDGSWLYYWWLGDGPRRLEKMPIDGGPAVVVREEDERALTTAVSADGSALYFVKPVRSNFFGLGRGTPNDICRARPENAASEVIFTIPGERIPSWAPGWTLSYIDLSPDGQWLVTSLIDGGTNNLWALPTAGGPMKQLTDFGDRSVTIARSVSWRGDSQHIYAAVAENDTDIVLIDGLIP